MRERRGSAIVLTLLLTLAATTALVALTSLVTSTARLQARWEAEIRTRYAFEGALEEIQSEIRRGLIVPPATVTRTVDAIAWTLTISDNNSLLRRTFKYEGVTNYKGRSYKRTAIAADPVLRSLFHYVLASSTSLSTNLVVTTGPAGKGSVYADGSVSILGLGSVINGDLETTSNLLPVGISVLGSTRLNTRKIAVPSIKPADYLAAANRTIATGTLSGCVFATPYELVYGAGNLTVSGVISGKGTVFVDGNLVISGNLSYADANSVVAFIVTGDVQVSASTQNYVGYFFAAKSFRLMSPVPVNLTKGAVFAGQGFDLSITSSYQFDDRVKNDQLLGDQLKLPGYWP